jgi:hypothetical protein
MLNGKPRNVSSLSPTSKTYSGIPILLTLRVSFALKYLLRSFRLERSFHYRTKELL